MLMDLKGQCVQFKIRDVYHPDPTKILIELHGDDLLTGKVVDLSDSGLEKDAFVVVEVQGIAELVIVAAARILGP
jgi:hypothetical protein